MIKIICREGSEIDWRLASSYERERLDDRGVVKFVCVGAALRRDLYDARVAESRIRSSLGRRQPACRRSDHRARASLAYPAVPKATKARSLPHERLHAANS